MADNTTYIRTPTGAFFAEGQDGMVPIDTQTYPRTYQGLISGAIPYQGTAGPGASTNQYGVTTSAQVVSPTASAPNNPPPVPQTPPPQAPGSAPQGGAPSNGISMPQSGDPLSNMNAIVFKALQDAQARNAAGQSQLRSDRSGIINQGLGLAANMYNDPLAGNPGATPIANDLALNYGATGKMSIADQLAQKNTESQQNEAQFQNLQTTLGMFKPTPVNPGESLVNPVTGEVVYKGQNPSDSITKTMLGPDGTPHDYQIVVDRFTQKEISRQDLGRTYVAPNMFNYFGSGPNGQPTNPGAQAVLDAINNGKLNPDAVNSRNVAFYGALYSTNPTFNSVQANAAAKFWESTGTQDKLAWAKSVDTNLSLLEKYSGQLSRTDLTLINGALRTGQILTGNTTAVQFANAANRTAAELSRVLGDSGGSDFRTKLATTLLDPNYSVKQMAAAIETERTMLNSLEVAFTSQGGQPAGTIGTGGAGGTVTMTGPKGTFSVSADKVQIMQQNGYSITQ